MKLLYMLLALFVVVGLITVYGHKAITRLQSDVSVLHARQATQPRLDRTVGGFVASHAHNIKQ